MLSVGEERRNLRSGKAQSKGEEAAKSEKPLTLTNSSHPFVQFSKPQHFALRLIRVFMFSQTLPFPRSNTTQEAILILQP